MIRGNSRTPLVRAPGRYSRRAAMAIWAGALAGLNLGSTSGARAMPPQPSHGPSAVAAHASPAPVAASPTPTPATPRPPRARSAASAVHDVRDYGAVGNGRADDRAAVQRALDAASAGGSDVVYVPAGTYALGTCVWVPSSVTIRGDGAASVLRARSGFPADAVLRLHDVRAVAIEDLTVDAMRRTNGVVSTGWSHEIALRRVGIANAVENGFMAWNGGPGPLSGFRLEECRIERAGHIGAYFGGPDAARTVSGIVVTGSTFARTSTASLDQTGAIYMEHVADAEVRDNTFVDIGGPMTPSPAYGQNRHNLAAIHFRHANGPRIVRNTIRRTSCQGILCYGTTGAVVADNDLASTHKVGIYLEASPRGTIERNVIADAGADFAGQVSDQGAGISVAYAGLVPGDGSPDTRIVGNRITGCRRNGIATDSDRNVVADNVGRDNGWGYRPGEWLPGYSAGLLVFGNHCTIRNNDMSDTRTPPRQPWCFAESLLGDQGGTSGGSNSWIGNRGTGYVHAQRATSRTSTWAD